jgi:hypothetical protein
VPHAAHADQGGIRVEGHGLDGLEADLGFPVGRQQRGQDRIGQSDEIEAALLDGLAVIVIDGRLDEEDLLFHRQSRNACCTQHRYSA